jgi:hypothetical protein
MAAHKPVLLPIALTSQTSAHPSLNPGLVELTRHAHRCMGRGTNKPDENKVEK